MQCRGHNCNRLYVGAVSPALTAICCLLRWGRGPGSRSREPGWKIPTPAAPPGAGLSRAARDKHGSIRAARVRHEGWNDIRLAFARRHDPVLRSYLRALAFAFCTVAFRIRRAGEAGGEIEGRSARGQCRRRAQRRGHAPSRSRDAPHHPKRASEAERHPAQHPAICSACEVRRQLGAKELKPAPVAVFSALRSGAPISTTAGH